MGPVEVLCDHHHTGGIQRRPDNFRLLHVDSILGSGLVGCLGGVPAKPCLASCHPGRPGRSDQCVQLPRPCKPGLVSGLLCVRGINPSRPGGIQREVPFLATTSSAGAVRRFLPYQPGRPYHGFLGGSPRLGGARHGPL